MNVLAIDTASSICRVGLAVAGQVYVEQACEQRDHARLLLPSIADLFQRAGTDASELDLITWNAGPGSFTGLRISSSTVQALAFAHELPVLSQSALKLMAQAAQLKEGETALCVIDARMASVYVAAYQRCGNEFIVRIEEQLLGVDAAKALVCSHKFDRLLGADCTLLALTGEALEVGPELLLQVASQSTRAEWIAAADCAPCYLRDATQWQKRTRIRN